jgi:hypothetical protein
VLSYVILPVQFGLLIGVSILKTMKKVFERMLADERLAGNEDLAPLQKGFLDAKNQVKQAKASKSTTKAAYQAAVQRGEKSTLLMMELLTAYRQAKHMLHYQQLAAELAKHQLYQWLDNWSRETAVPQSSKEQKAKKKQGGKASKVAVVTEQQETVKVEEKKQKNGPTVSK